MNRILLLILLFFLYSCSGTKSTEGQDAGSQLTTISLIKGNEDSQSVKVPEGSHFASIVDMPNQSLIVGELMPDSNIKTKSGTVLLTQIAMMEARPPESGLLTYNEADIGKTVVIAGHYQGDVVYRATIICSFSVSPSKKLWQKFESGAELISQYCQ